LRYKGAVNAGAASTKQEQFISVLAAFFKSFLIILLILTPRASLAKVKHRKPEMASKERGDTLHQLDSQLKQGLLIYFLTKDGVTLERLDFFFGF
jgi:hypothetical protein